MKKRLNLESETLCGYKVSSKMKKVWQVELDLLVEFDRVCKKHNLKYIIFDGSLLGTIRHKGFIPWDDDIDVALTRDEYNKLLKIADKEFKDPFFLQNPLNDNVYRGHSQLRDSRTTAIMYKEFNRDANQGIFIDIFVVDKIPDNFIKLKIQRRRCRIMKSLLRFYRVYDCKDRHSLKSKIIKKILDVFYKIVGYENFYRHYERVCAKYNKTDTKYCNISEYYYGDRKIRVDHMVNIREYPYEYIMVPGPVNAEEFLTDFFGDWKKYVIGGGDHGETFFDPENSYKKYISKTLDEIRKIEEKQ